MKKLTLYKKSAVVNVEFIDRSTGESTWRPITQTVRDDGTNIINLFGQINWGVAKFRRNRKQCGQFMAALRDLNIANSEKEEGEIEVEIPEMVAKVLYDALQKDDILNVVGTSMLETVAYFEDWYQSAKE